MFLIASLAAALPAPISVGDQLPQLRGEFLTGREAVLPGAAAGRAALLMLGFTYDSRFSVEAWAGRFRKDFGAEPKVTFFEVPIIGGLAKMGKWFIDSGMRRGTPKADQENVITAYSGSDAWKNYVGFRDPRAAYLILIDAAGKVVWVHAGGFDEASYKGLSTQLTGLLEAPALHR